jgi:hypothetical protein
MADKQAVFAAPVWCGAEYSRVSPGVYTAFATRTQGPEWCHAYRRYSLMIEFELLGERDTTRVCLFLNLGSDPKKPPGRLSNFYKAWTIANGEPPKRGQTMEFDVFTQGQLYEIEVGMVGQDSEQRPKSDAEFTRSRLGWLGKTQNNDPRVMPKCTQPFEELSPQSSQELNH